MHPALVKAKFIGKIAAQHDWKGNMASDISSGDIRVTTITGQRNDEYFQMQWTGEKLSHATYFIAIDGQRHDVKITHSKKMIEYLTGWPDIIKMYQWFPEVNRPWLTERYRKLPFSMDDPNEKIIECLVGQKISWYGHQSVKIHEDVVLPKKSKTLKTLHIVDIGHRKLFHFMGAQAGFRSVLLDTLLKVG